MKIIQEGVYRGCVYVCGGRGVVREKSEKVERKKDG